MVGFGIAVGIGIAFVRERTGLANDTVIGVFFAFAIGFGGMLFASMQRRTTLNPESFLFGSPLNVYERDILALFGLALVLALLSPGATTSSSWRVSIRAWLARGRSHCTGAIISSLFFSR